MHQWADARLLNVRFSDAEIIASKDAEKFASKDAEKLTL